MLTFLKPYLALAVAFAIIAIALVIWFSGVHHGGGTCQAKWDKQSLVDSQIVTNEQAKRINEEHRYELQLRAATDQAVAHRAELDRLRAAPHPSVLCHAAPESSGSPLPGVPASPVPDAAAARPVPPNIDFDPSERLYAEVADAADYAVEACRDALARWPH